MSRVSINGYSFDPVRDGDRLRAIGWHAADAAHSNHILVQTDGLLTGERKAGLAGAGVEILEYIPDDTYLCRYRPADLDAVRALPYVRWADVYQPDLKVEPALRTGTTDRTGATASTGAPDSTGATDRPEALTATEPAPAEPVEVVFHDGVDTGAPALADRLTGLAATAPRVTAGKARLTVAEGRLFELASWDEVRAVSRVTRYGPANNVARAILNAGVLVGGTTYRGEGQVVGVADSGFDKGSTADVHPAFTGRVIRLYAFGRPDRTDDPQGHGTHVCGSILGAIDSPDMGGRIEGTAPHARLVLQSMLDDQGEWGGLPDDVRDLFRPVYEADGVRVHNNSWGPLEVGLPYDTGGREVDDFVWHHPDMVICFAASNDGADADGDGVIDRGTVGGVAAAKNCITVGASENCRPDIPITYGERRPHQFLKALLINGAVELTGQYAPSEAGSSPNHDSGFGRVDLARSIIVPGRTRDAGFHQGDPLAQEQEYTTTVEIPATGATLKVTLVWTDPPGAGLQNDLDLVVRAADGRERHGNMGEGTGYDRANNVEQVWWTGVPAGRATVTVRAHRVTARSQPFALVWRLT